MSKRVKIAVIREATLNAKPTDTHYLAEGGLKISRRDARALKGTTLYYEVLVDLGKVTGFDFISGRDIPVYLTDSESVLALDPQSLRLVDVQDKLVEITVKHVTFTHSVDSSIIPQNAPVEPMDPISSVLIPLVPIVSGSTAVVPPEAPVKRKPGRPKKVVAVAPEPEQVENTPEPELVEQGIDPEAPVAQEQSDFEVTEKQDDESTFLIDPNAAAPIPVTKAKPEFSFDVDEDEAPPPPVRNTPQTVDFVVEEEETPAPVSASAPAAVSAEKIETIVTSTNTDDFGDVEPGLFDE